MSSSTETITQIPENKKYLNDIGVTEPLQKRIDEIHSYIQRISPCKVQDFFIADYVKEDGTHVYKDIDFCTDKGYFTAVDFVSSIDIAVGVAAEHIAFTAFEARDYDFVKANEKSRLIVHIGYDISHVAGEFRATGINCDYLMKYIKQHFLPVLRT